MVELLVALLIALLVALTGAGKVSPARRSES